jgi:hypothetical protein
MAVGVGIAFVQQFHRLDRCSAAAQGHVDPLIQGQVIVLNGCQTFVDIGVMVFLHFPF